jgi:hypothetical protein
MALCFGCLCSFRALPYACRIEGGRATVVHSWDEDFLRDVVTNQVIETRRHASTGTLPRVGGAYVRERLALRRLRGYDAHRQVCADVDLLVFSNSNKEQTLDVHHLAEPIAAWLRTTAWSADREAAYRHLTRALHNSKVAGSHMLAKVVFSRPEQLPHVIAVYLREASDRAGTRKAGKTTAAANAAGGNGKAGRDNQVPIESSGLAQLCFSYANEVLDVPSDTLGQLHTLASNIADIITASNSARTVKTYRYAHRETRVLRRWLSEAAVTWTLRQATTTTTTDGDGPTGRAPFITTAQMRELFDPDPDVTAWLNRDLLLIAVMEELQRRGWQVDAGEDRAALEDIDLFDDTLFTETTKDESE